MGSRDTATQRLNLAQSFNPVGLIGGLVIAQQFVLTKLKSDDVDFSSLGESAKATIRQADLVVIRDPYVVLGLVVIAVLVMIVLNKMPESRSDDEKKESVWQAIKVLFQRKQYAMGVVSQAFYVGAQIMCWTYIYHYAEHIGIDSETAGYYQFVAFVVFFLGRFVCTFLMRFINSGRLLMILSMLAVACTLGTIFIEGIYGLYSLVSISFCMSLMFPTIYGIALEGLTEEESKIGAAGLVMAIVGGALMPTLQGMILDLGGAGSADLLILGLPEVNISFVLPLLCFLVIAGYGKYVKAAVK